MFRTITKSELLEALEEVPDDGLVVMSSDYGDHSHTQQVLTIQGDVTQRCVEKSAYSDSGYAIVDEDREDREEQTRVWLLE